MKELRSIANAIRAIRAIRAIATIATILTPGTSVLLLATATIGIVLASADTAAAQTVRMNNRQSVNSVSRNTRQAVRQVARTPANAGQDIARNANQASRQVSRNSYQSARQISRRHFYTIPAAGYRWVTYGTYRYCYYGGLYYYPYMYGGKTVYIQVNATVSNPVPPPAS
jgi:hypothetical protein